MESRQIFLLLICAYYTLAAKHHQTIVLLSFDGFRHDYARLHNLSRFAEFGRDGVSARSMRPTFVTKTFPNHFTVVTGLYEESHGILSNYMYDPVFKGYFSPRKSSYELRWWQQASPIWIENERQFLTADGKRTRKSATIYWPGSETSYNGHWQYYTEKIYNINLPFKDRVDRIVSLLLEPDPVNFVACYFEEPDFTSHLYGPEHKKTADVLQKVDVLLGYYIDKMKSVGLYDKVNTILVSDHGMMTVHQESVTTLTDYVTPGTFDLINYGTFLLIRSKKKYREQIYRNLSKIDHLSTYKKEDIPASWHYKNNRRVTDIFAIADLGYYISPNETFTRGIQHPFGDHGYTNNASEMHGIFYARGPAFKRGYTRDTLENIDLCSLMCHVLKIRPPAHNGSLARVSDVLLEENLFTLLQTHPTYAVVLLSVCGIFVFGVLCVCSVSCVRNIRRSAKYTRLSQQTDHPDDDVIYDGWSDEERESWCYRKK